MIVYGAPRPKPRHEGEGFYGASPHTPTENHYIWGFAPSPDSRTFLPKSPRDPKKTNWIRYILSSIDSEQGCRRQPCFLFGADSTAPLALAARPAHLLVSAPTSYIARAVATGLHPHPPSFAPPFLPRSLCAPHICTARARNHRSSSRRSSETAGL